MHKLNFCKEYFFCQFSITAASVLAIICWSEICQTGPKGVVEDWRRYKQLEVEKREEASKEKALLAKHLAHTCRSHVCTLISSLLLSVLSLLTFGAGKLLHLPSTMAAHDSNWL